MPSDPGRFADDRPPEPLDLAPELHDLPRLVLDPPGLDLLELAIGDGLAGGVALAARALAALTPPLVLTDLEQVPLGLFEFDDTEAPSGDERVGHIRALRSRALRTGPAADHELRRSARETRSMLADIAEHGDVLAVVFSELPTHRDLARAADEIDRRHGCLVLWTVVVSSGPALAPHRPDDDGLARAVLAVAPPGAIRLVVPSPSRASEQLRPVLDSATDEPDQPDPPARLRVESLLRYGATVVFDQLSERDDSDREQLAQFDRGDEFREGALDANALDAVYPLASVAEFRSMAERSARHPLGAVVLMTGLSGSGKSTVARALAERIEHRGMQQVTVLDGDEMRQLLSSELGFDRRSRELNVQRIGYVASLLARVGSIAIAAPIAPFDESRQEIRRRVAGQSIFVLVHVATPLAVCEARDRKGLYARARAGQLGEFTGISSPYEPPVDADIVIDTSVMSIGQCVDAIDAVLVECVSRGHAQR